LVGREALAAPSSWTQPGEAFSNYGQPPNTREWPIRWIAADPSSPVLGGSWTPLHELEGTITPNGLHFERHHNGVPTLSRESWRMELSGEVAPNPVQAPAGYLHGLVSGAQWTGVPVAPLLDRAGVKIDGGWLIATGLDASGVTVSLPLEEVYQRGVIALYQNGEPLRPEHGYPARVLVPGWEGITQVKWLGRLHVAKEPAMSRFDTVSYTDLQADGRARRFTHAMGVKSVITSPTVHTSVAHSDVQVTGLAWSGHGTIQRVEVSLDGGSRWHDARLDEPRLERALTRFRYPWRRTRKRAVLLSRATDSMGFVQPTRTQLIDEQGANAYYHYNAIVGWAVDVDGHVSHVYP